MAVKYLKALTRDLLDDLLDWLRGQEGVHIDEIGPIRKFLEWAGEVPGMFDVVGYHVNLFFESALTTEQSDAIEPFEIPAPATPERMFAMAIQS